MEAMPGVSVDFHDANNLMTFSTRVKPYDGLYKGAEFEFTVNVPNSYPYEPPKVVCKTLVRILLFLLKPFSQFNRSIIRILIGKEQFA